MEQALEAKILTFHKPMEGQRTKHACPISCKITGIPEDMEVWIVKEPWEGSFHPDSAMTRNGDEFQGTARIGNATRGADYGKNCPVHIICCSPYAGHEFGVYIQHAQRTNKWPGISSIYDGQILGTVTVIRDDRF
jgi:hypothetical protein